MSRSWRKRVAFGALVATIVVLGSRRADSAEDSFSYFRTEEIDFWARPERPKSQPRRESTPSIPKAGTPTQFPWQKYLEPGNDEFFREGDYTPPAPFMEIARNPSDENIANWFKYLETKNAIMRRLQGRLEAHAGGRSSRTPLEQTPESVLVAAGPLSKSNELEPDAKRFRLRLYFDSKCPHCHRMLGTISNLAQAGFWIELRQTDGDLAARRLIPFPVTAATPTELKRYEITAVPTLLVGDLKRGSFFKMSGYQTPDAIIRALQSPPSPQTSTKGGPS